MGFGMEVMVTLICGILGAGSTIYAARMQILRVEAKRKESNKDSQE
jgi:hypothetical protein